MLNLIDQYFMGMAQFLRAMAVKKGFPFALFIMQVSQTHEKVRLCISDFFTQINEELGALVQEGIDKGEINILQGGYNMQKHMIAMGDSLTEGIGDEVKDVQLKSWVTHFAELHEPALAVTNLAKRGLLSHQIRATQLEEAVSLKPDIVSLVAGGNDVLKDEWNPEQYQADMEFMVQQLTQLSNVTIITSTLPDFTIRLPLPSDKKQIMKEQLLKANEIILSLSKRHELLLIDFWNHPLSQEPTVWSQDLVHPNSIGYQEIGRIVYNEYTQWQEKR